jgi:DNA-binding transcriptional ArsR family regulator
MSQEYIDIKIKFIRGFGDKTRLLILECIKDNEKSVSQIMEEVQGSQSSISQHISCLKGCGLIVGRQDGKFIYYRLKNEQIKQLLSMFDTVLASVEENIAICETHFE